jgi:spore germination protein GerM
MKNSNLKVKLLFSCPRYLTILCFFLILILIPFNIGCEIIEDTFTDTSEGENVVEDNETEAGVKEDSSSTENNIENNIVEESGNNSDTDNASEDNEQSNEEEQSEDSNGELTINVYYSDEQGEYLVGESRTVSSDNKYVDALYELMKLPVNENLFRLIPDTTIINSVTVSNGEAVVDMSENFVEDRFDSDTTDILLVYSVVNTLTEFPEVQSVAFHINGQKLDLLGMLDISSPIYRRDDLIK